MRQPAGAADGQAVRDQVPVSTFTEASKSIRFVPLTLFCTFLPRTAVGESLLLPGPLFVLHMRALC